MGTSEKLLITVIFGVMFIVCALLVWMFTQGARNKERRLLIEKGINPDEYASTKSNGGSAWVKLGYLAVGLGIGLALIALLGSLSALYGPMPVAILCICGGGALILENRISKKDKV